MTQTLIVKGDLPSLNSTIEGAKQSPYKYSAEKKRLTNLFWLAATSQLKPVESKPVDFVFHWYCKDRRKDKDNICANKKCVLDGLVAAKIIGNDNWEWVGNFQDYFDVDKSNPRVEVTIHEIHSQTTTD